MRALLTVAVLALGINAFATETKTAPATAPAAAPAAPSASAPAAAAAPAAKKEEATKTAAATDECASLKGKAKKACMKKHEGHK